MQWNFPDNERKAASCALVREIDSEFICEVLYSQKMEIRNSIPILRAEFLEFFSPELTMRVMAKIIWIIPT